MTTPPLNPAERDAPRILIVEDDEGNREVLAYFLRRQGFEVATAPSGEAALTLLETIETAPFRMVLLDVVMPGIGGLETLRALRQRFSAESLPVIMVTGLDGGEDVAAALDMGATDYVSKPYQLADALALIRSVLARTATAAETPRDNLPQ
jgi:DNA-binding response OmpR family regulator